MLNRIFPRTHRFHCPDEHQLAAYVDQQLIGAERERVESHLAKCDSCLQQVGFLVKQSQVVADPAPASLVHRAEQLETAGHEDAPFGWKWVSVAAAIAVVAIGVVVSRKAHPNIEEHSTIVATAQLPPAPIIRDNASGADAAVRSVSPPHSLLLVLSPQPGAIVQASDFIIRWEAVPNAAAYEVRVVTADGDLVWHKRVHENSVSPPKQTLRPGLKYFVWVRAWLADGKTQQSAAVGFIGG
jgi:anti-sigma factor RsiW